MIIHGTYRMHVGNYDWGCGVDQAIVTLDQAIDSIDQDMVSVTARKMFTDRSKKNNPLYEGAEKRKVEACFLSDEKGNEVEGPSCHFCIKLYVSPEEGSPLVSTGPMEIFIWSDPYDLLITYQDSNNRLSIEEKASGIDTAADMFAMDTYLCTEGIRYDYASYSPEVETDTLFVWLHGLGEGQYPGSNAYLPLLGRKGCTMAGEAFQSTIGYAHILVPQCPTYWMDASGKADNFGNGLIEADATSFYTKSLAEFIDIYAKKVSASKIVIAGCSNGGYMCLLLALYEPEKYRAVIPICEAVPDRALSDADIETLSQVPLYFVYSKNDPIVIPEIHEIPTIERLKKVGAKDLHVSVTDHVYDTSGKYYKEDGSAYEYMGHLSWIYYDNNETDDGNGLAAWDWIVDNLR